MESNKKHLSEEEIQERILAINRKIDEELLDFENVDMERIDEYLCQIRELDGTPPTTEAELMADLQIIYKRAAEYEKRKSFWHFDSIGVRAAGIAAAILIAFTCTMTVSAVRDPFVSFCMNAYEKYTELFFDASDIEKAPSTIETFYTLGFVPEGYELYSQSIEREATVSIWQKKDGNSIKLNQDILTAVSTLDKEDRDIVSYNIEDIQILFKEKYGKKIYFWNTNEYQFQLYIVDEDISAEDGIELIRSIIKYEK